MFGGLEKESALTPGGLESPGEVKLGLRAVRSAGAKDLELYGKLRARVTEVS